MDLEKLKQIVQMYQSFLQEKVYLLKRLEEFGQQVHQALVEKNEELIPEFVDSRGKVMNKIDLLEEEKRQVISVFKTDQGKLILDKLGVVSEPARQLEHEVAQLLKKLSDQDGELNNLMQLRHRELASKINQIRNGKKMNNAYDHGHDHYDAYYFDHTK